MSPLPRFGPYVALSVLGQGGMGTVYSALHPRLGFELAIKVLSSGRAATDAQRKRFLREIRALGELCHPGLVNVVDAGEEGGVPWFAMRRVAGRSLEQRLRSSGPLSPAEAVKLGLQLCEAMSVAHECGILHRDLKPDNVLCARDGRYVVTDFGLTKDLSREASAQLSETGALLGTPGYWAPELASGQGKEASFGTDVYGVGAVLYAALTGAPPFTGESLLEVSLATLERAPIRPSTLADVPRGLERIVLRCLEKSPANRFASLAALGEELRRLEERTTSPDRVRWAWVSGAIGLLTLVAALTWAHRDPRGRFPSSAGNVGGQTSSPTAPPRPISPSPSPPAAAPSWYLALAQENRPPLPLPIGVSFGAKPHGYVNRADESILVWVSAGNFAMGSEAGEDDEQPVHVVSLRDGFFLGKREITWRQYEAYCRTSGRAVPNRIVNRFSPPDDHPVVNVSWDDAVAYCGWAGLRLPSEAEWEYAARGPQNTTWPWGEEPPGGSLLNLADQSAYWDWPAQLKRRFSLEKAEFNDGFSDTAPVGSYPRGRSPSGCLDLAGNVSEWVQDSYRLNYEGAPTDGRAHDPRDSSLRVFRGGSWNDDAVRCRSANRYKNRPDTRGEYLGFRPARSLEP
ncbi:MAG: SUMF1/EgtB/PvdO family nonheme iron enzyme [Planctomycetes bacterium]|nr:SUMF1/EgtB/PvdO family nonheme iron enzyme [Planctomycetota bacterium]